MVVNVLAGEALADPAHSLGEPVRIPSNPVRILAFGDSLTSGYALEDGQSFPAKLEKALKAEGRDVTVANGGVAGDTTQGGRARLDWVVAVHRPELVILELGANDGLRGLEPKLTRANLDAILKRLKAMKVGVLFTGMLAPPNYGAAFEAEFKTVFHDLAREHDVLFYPFFMEGVAGDPKYILPDGLHPSAKGVDEIVRRILPSVRQLLDRHAKEPAK